VSPHSLLVALAIAIVVWALAIAVLFAFGKPRAARELIVLVPNLLRLFRGLLGDPRVPRSAKAALAIGAVWIASPIDLIPEFIPVLGPLDDAIVAAVILRFLVRRTGLEVIHEHWNGNPETLDRVLGRFSRRGTSSASALQP